MTAPVWTNIAWIAFGGALGALARFALVRAFPSSLTGGAGGPAATLAVNVIGCLVFGFLLGWWLRPAASPPPESLRLGVFVGFLGSFTTFSTYAADTVRLAQGGSSGAALANVVAHNGIGLLALWLGLRLATMLPRG